MSGANDKLRWTRIIEEVDPKKWSGPSPDARKMFYHRVERDGKREIEALKRAQVTWLK